MKQGQLIPKLPRRMTDADLAELQLKLDAGSVPVPEAGCVLWEHGVTNAGYGGVYYGPPKKRFISAHRAAWILANGNIPDGMFVCHRCDTRRCVNPDHLFLGTPLDNMRDMIEKARDDFPAGERHSHAKLTDADVLAIRASGLNSTDAGRKFGISDCTASQILNGHRWTQLPLDTAPRPPKRVNRGEAAPSAKLTAQQALEIFRSAGMATDVGRRFGVSDSTVRAIRNGRIWKQVTGAKAA